MTTTFRWLKEEMINLIPVIFYFFICFNLFHYAQVLLFKPDDVQFTGYVGATLGSLFAGKIILIAENIPFINAFPNKPIIYNITWKFFVYSIFVLLAQLIDYFVKEIYYTGSWAIAYEHLKYDVNLSRFWGIQIYVLTIFLAFIIFSELTRVIGKAKMKKIFFGR